MPAPAVFSCVASRNKRDKRHRPGFRDSGNLTQWGGLMYVSTNGYSWASTVNDTDGMNLGLSVTWLVSSCPSGRAYGFQLRCLSE